MTNEKIILATVVSVDGYVCAINGSTSLLKQYYEEFLPAGMQLLYPGDCGAVLVGRRTYDQYQTQLADWAKQGLQIIVASHEQDHLAGNVIWVKGDLAVALKKVQEKLQCNIWVLGGPNVVNQLTSANEVDEIRLTTVPVQLGGGKPLFDTDLPAPHVTVEQVEQYGGLTYSVWLKK